MSNQDHGSFEKSTRAVFDAHHRAQASDGRIFSRLVTLIEPAYFGVADDFFAGKTVLDAGCGSNANASRAFLELGAKVVALDLGDQWQSCARETLADHAGKFELVNGDVQNLPFEDGEFEFVHCAGVLHHCRFPERGFSELGRVTGAGGRCFVSVMANGDGLIYEVFNFLRRKYKVDPQFKQRINDLSAERISESLDWIFAYKKEMNDEYEFDERTIRALFDEDFVLTIKDRLEAPTYHAFDFSEEQIRLWFDSAGFSDIRRITRYLRHFTNVRSLLTPMYHDYEHPLSRFLFGEGYVQMIGTK